VIIAAWVIFLGGMAWGLLAQEEGEVIMTVVFLILLLLSLVCFLVAASGRALAQVNLVALGLALWVAVPLIQTIQTLAS
jgi:lipoprotein signal peptidase